MTQEEELLLGKIKAAFPGWYVYWELGVLYATLKLPVVMSGEIRLYHTGCLRRGEAMAVIEKLWADLEELGIGKGQEVVA